MKRIISLILSLVISISAFLTVGTSAYAATNSWKRAPEKNGSTVRYYNSSSDLLVVGDSRTSEASHD